MVSPTTDRRLGLVGNTPFKAPVTAVADSNITQSGQQAIDGVSVLAINSAGVADRVLCVGMTDTTKNGIWDVSTAAWTRSKDANNNYDLTQGSTVNVQQGTVYGGTYWKVNTTGTITIGTTAMVWARALTTDLNFLQFLQTGTGAVGRGAQDRMRDLVSVKDFGARGNGTTDDTAAINAAIASVVAAGGRVFFPAGTYKTSTTITLGGAGISLVGAGMGATILKASTAATPLITLTSGSNRLSVCDMTLDSSLARTNGGYGIYSPGVVSNCTFDNLQVQNQWNGFQLGATDSSLIRHCFSNQNYNSGFAITTVNTGSGGGCQWTFQNILAQLNDANGIEIRSTAFGGVSQMTLGGFFDVNLFANTGFGLVVLGAVGCPIFGVRVNGMFSGQNGSDSLFLDTFANQHNITNFYFEIDGTSPTGRSFTTPATNTAHGCTLTSSNTSMRMSSGLIKAPSLGGIVNQCSESLLINDVRIEDCGGSVANAGFYHNTASGRLMMNGCFSGNTGVGASQTYGLFVDNGGVGVSAIGCDFSSNATGAVGATSNLSQVNLIGCFPNTFGNQLIGGLVLGAATGGNKGVGTLNVATNNFKNGTAYTNP